MTAILVTGGAGFIGSHTCKALARSGFLPVAYDNLSRGRRDAVKWGPLFVADIRDSEKLATAFKIYRPAAVLHFAAFAYVGESVENPLLYYENNVAGSIALLRAIVSYGPVPLVFSSTCATYGLPTSLPISEDHPQYPINPYGFTKLCVERLIADVGSARQMPWVSLRYFNASGSDPEGEIGEAHDPETHLIPLVLKSALTGEPLKIFGTDYDTPDGTCVRDYVHVADLANAHVLAVRHLLQGSVSCALNLANSRGYSVREVVAAAEAICGKKIPQVQVPRRPGDPPALIGSAQRARQILNWKPDRSTLEDQIIDAKNWILKRAAGRTEAATRVTARVRRRST
jgi:UDP-glucose-4-epimerase GalE